MALSKKEKILAMQKNQKESIIFEGELDIQDTPLSSSVNTINDIISEAKHKQIKEEDPKAFEPYPDEDIRLNLHTGSRRETLMDTIKENGIIEPVLIWNNNGHRYIMAGHNRADIAQELGIKIPYIEYADLSKTQADKIVILTNMANRQINEMKPMEISNLLTRLSMSYDDTYTKQEIYEEIDTQFKLERKKIIQYLKLQQLFKGFQELLDNNQIPFGVAYRLCFASESKQQSLYEYMKRNQIDKISLKQMELLEARDLSPWDNEFLNTVFDAKREQRTSPTHLTIKMKEMKGVYGKPVEKEKIIQDLQDYQSIIKIYEKLNHRFDKDELESILKEHLKND